MLLNRLANSHRTIRCIITSRPEPHIMSTVTGLTDKVTQISLEDEVWKRNEDIRAYLRAGFDIISARMPPKIPAHGLWTTLSTNWWTKQGENLSTPPLS